MVVEARVGLVGGEGAPVAADRYPSLEVGKAAQGRQMLGCLLPLLLLAAVAIGLLRREP